MHYISEGYSIDYIGVSLMIVLLVAYGFILTLSLMVDLRSILMIIYRIWDNQTSVQWCWIKDVLETNRIPAKMVPLASIFNLLSTKNVNFKNIVKRIYTVRWWELIEFMGDIKTIYLIE